MTSKGKKFQNQSYSLKAQKKLDEKIRSLESVIVEIKDKFSLPDETINLLHSSASKILEELFQRVTKKVKIDKPKYKISNLGIYKVFKNKNIMCYDSMNKFIFDSGL